MHPELAPHVPVQRAVEVHRPTPYPPAVPATAPVVPVQPNAVPAVASIVLPDGRVVNVALGGAGFLAVCGGLMLLTSFIAALTAFITQLIILAAVRSSASTVTGPEGSRSTSAVPCSSGTSSTASYAKGDPLVSPKITGPPLPTSTIKGTGDLQHDP